MSDEYDDLTEGQLRQSRKELLEEIEQLRDKLARVEELLASEEYVIRRKIKAWEKAVRGE